MRNEELIRQYEKIVNSGNSVQISHEPELANRFKIFTMFDDSKYETHTYCNVSNIK